jgi:hypothetical protein
VNRSQWIIIGVGILLLACLYRFGRKAPKPSEIKTPVQSIVQNELTADSILFHAKEVLKPNQLTWMNDLEQSVIRGDVKTQKLNVYHQLAHFWKDSIGILNRMHGMKLNLQDWKIPKNHSPLLPICFWRI